MLRPALVVGAAALGVASLLIARSSPQYSFAGDAPLSAAAALAAGWSLVAAGTVAWSRRSDGAFGPLLVVAGMMWFAPEWSNPAAGSTAAFTLGLILYAACPAVVSHAVLCYPHGVSRHSEHVLAAAGYASVIVLLGLLPAMFFDPAAQGCGQCPGNLLLIRDDPAAVGVLARSGLVLGLGWATAVGLLLAWRLAASSVPRRRLIAPVYVPTLLYLALVAASYQHAVDRGFLSNDPTDRQLWLGQAAALVCLGAGTAWRRVRDRRVRASVARLVTELAGSPAPGRLRDALARTLRDPTLEVLYQLSPSRCVDALGRPATADPDHVISPLVSAGRPIALLAHSRELHDDPGLVDAVTSVARLALHNERLRAEAHAQLEDLRASRARIVESGDAARRRLERDLHDGAQQRLVALALAVRLARMRLPADADTTAVQRLALAERELQAALAELRDIAHGIFPSVLGDDGLAAALDMLAEGSPALLRLTAVPDERFAPAVESAAYALVAEAVRHGGGPTTVAVQRADGALLIDVDVVGRAFGTVTDVEDRLGALGGTVAVSTVRGGTRIHGTVPCVS